MPNQYKYNCTLDELIEEEDREVRNDLMRSQRCYYDTLHKICYRTLCVMEKMTDEELKEAIINNGFKSPVDRL